MGLRLGNKSRGAPHGFLYEVRGYDTVLGVISAALGPCKDSVIPYDRREQPSGPGAYY